MIRSLKRFLRQERGAVTIEFVLWFPLFFGIFLSSVESGMLMLRYVMLERGVDVTVRDLRIGTLKFPSHDDLKREICRNSLILPDCVEG
ncbi:MAG: pilus assembly protein, partial [Rhodobacteraceae bacterium]|nr:pilus assembly protein [Paracoccaceae bacterium]MCB2137968.1 pilus assembly protein [Paracoccaceae bacterium]MCB2151323.1 pilus assembly protein [Paracoccaceae bacterium]